MILGGGFVGLSCAYWAKKNNPHLNIILVEENTVGFGASTKNAGFLTKGSLSYFLSLEEKWGTNVAHETFYFAEKSINLVHEELLKKSSLNFNQTSSLSFLKKENFSNNFFQLYDHSFAKILNTNCYKSDNEIQIHPDSFIKYLRSKCEQLGVSIFEHMIAEYDLLNELKIPIFFCLNAYTANFLKSYQNVIKPYRAQMCEVEMNHPVQDTNLFYYPEERVYWRFIDNKIWVGGKRLVDESNECTNQMGLNLKIQSELARFTFEKLQIIGKVSRQWSGIMGFTDDEKPLCEKISDKEHYILAGFSGHGMGYGFHGAKQLVEFVFNGEKQPFFFSSVRDRI